MTDLVATFRALHASGCFVMPNAWDAGTAMALQQMRFPALGTTSAGLAFSRGVIDQVWTLRLEHVLANLHDIVAAARVPVNADFQAGYAQDADGVHASVARCVATGVAGLSIEDALGQVDRPLYDRAAAIDRVRAARAAIDASGVPVMLTARCEAWLFDLPDAERIALDRLVAFADAGADCLFAPGVRDPAHIAAIVRAVAPRPVNVIASSAGSPSVAELAALGVRRISVGSALARAAWAAFLRAANDIASTGTFGGLADAAPFDDLNTIFSREMRAYPGPRPPLPDPE